jgi:hypothetical protein
MMGLLQGPSIRQWAATMLPELVPADATAGSEDGVTPPETEEPQPEQEEEAVLAGTAAE